MIPETCDDWCIKGSELELRDCFNLKCGRRICRTFNINLDDSFNVDEKFIEYHLPKRD